MIKTTKLFIRRWGVGFLLFMISLGILDAQALPLLSFLEYENNPIYGQHVGNGRAYYPSVIGSAGSYYMWFANGSGGILRGVSSDGITWTGVTQIAFSPALPGGVSPNHPTVIYHSDIGYKMYFWDGTTGGLSTMVAESDDGLNWTNPRHITQDPAQPLQGSSYGTPWYHHYGPGQAFYNPGAVNSGGNPWDYSYIMTFDTSGEGYSAGVGVEHCGLAYSEDGDYWRRYGDNPILASTNDGNWDSRYIYHGTIIRNGNFWYMWYSGADGTGVNYYAQGIGEAYSNDGLTWTKFSAPIFRFSDGIPWRNERTYAQCVLYENGLYKMWFSGKDSTQYSLGYATFTPSITVTGPQAGYTWYSGLSYAITWTWTGPIASVNIEYSTDDGDTYTPIINATENDGIYTWSIPAGLASETCKIKISDANGIAFDESDTFYIRPLFISVTNPGEGDVYANGSTLPITWTWAGPFRDVKIQLSTDNGATYTSIIDQTDNDGSYDWVIPSTIASSTCRIKISTLNGSTFGISGVFTIAGGAWLPGNGPSGIYYGTAYGYSRHIGVGNQGRVVYSTDGIAWTQSTSPTTSALNDIYFNGQYFVTVGENTSVFVCNSNWQWLSRQGNLPQGKGINGVTFGNNRWIAVGDSGFIIKGNTDASVWTVVTLTQPYPDLLDITYGNNVFAAVGKDKTILTGSDGVQWVSRKLVSPLVDINDITFSDTLQLFAAVGEGGLIATSSDGSVWKKRTSGTTADLQGVLWSGGKFVALGLGGIIMESSNGITWTAANSGVAADLYSVGYGGNTWTALGNNVFLFNLGSN